MSDSLFVDVWWTRDEFGFEWCHACVVLQGVPQVERSARRAKGKEGNDPGQARSEAISLAKHEFGRTIKDFRDRAAVAAEGSGETTN